MATRNDQFVLEPYVSSVVNAEVSTVGKDIENDVTKNLDKPAVCTIPQNLTDLSIATNPRLQNDSTLSDSLALRDTDLSHQRCISHDKSVETATTLMSKEKKIQHISLQCLNDNTSCSKVLAFFGLCFIIGCFFMPFTIYHVNQTMESDKTDIEFLHEKNTSTAKIKLIEACSFLASNIELDCMDQILYTYESLRTINLPSSQLYCTERVERLFCDALMECSNESRVKDIVCQQVRQEYCTAEWRLLEVYNQTDQLIDCEEYEETAPVNCSHQFDLTNDGTVCLPLCGEFSLYSEAYTTLRVVLYATVSSLVVIGGMVVIIISFKKRKAMFCFPRVLVVINAGILTMIHFLEFISIVSIDRWNILCSKQFVFDALDNPTVFCTMQGSLELSGILLYSYFWLLYVFHLSLKVFYPLKSAKLFDSNYMKLIYISALLIAFLIGIVPSVALATTGPNYRVTGFPPTHCVIDSSYRIYALGLPVLLTTSTMMILMIFIVYILHTRHGIFKWGQKKSTEKQVCICQFTVPEVKIVFVLLYWLFCITIASIVSTISDGRAEIIINVLQSYVGCMAGGNRKDHDCHELREDLEAEANPVLEVIRLISIAFLNFASLPFVIQFQTVKKFCKTNCKKV